ncbi:MAG: hypothetical protein GX306_01805 [Clostridiales bacterium]|jgi:nitrogen regulatory protein PII|nr:hypothetical protein [Clostridiales bacterium]
MDNNHISNNRIQMLTSIVDYSLGHKVIDIYKKNRVPVNLVLHGYGAANSEIYDILGFGEVKKSVIFSVMTETMANSILDEMHKKMDLNKPGTGIAFTISLSGCSSILSKLCLTADDNRKSESEEFHMMQKEPYDLILSIVSGGLFSEVMDVAKAAGATGGTLIHARGVGSEEAAKFLGITIQPEKDIVMILTPHEHRHRIMEKITKEFGLATAGKGICFSLPVSAAMGLGTHSISIDND